MSYEPSVSLHQQDGGMSVQAFAELEGLTLKQARYYIKRGKVLGARQDARSKHWWIYPPAKLLERPRSHANRSLPGAAASIVAADYGICKVPGAVVSDLPSHTPDEAAALRLPVHPTEAQEAHAAGGILEGGRCTPSPESSAEGSPPSAGLVLDTPAAALPDAVRCGARAPASSGGLVVYAEARNVCRMLHEAAMRQYREGIHYLRLNAREFAQLYAALDNERSRIRKLVGKGLLPVGQLRASDSTWQKMQAMCREGKLL